jgi:hypothetical protein
VLTDPSGLDPRFRPAHATSSDMAEGAAMALEDALVLAERLGGIAAGPCRTDGIRGASSPTNRLGAHSNASPRQDSPRSSGW